MTPGTRLASLSLVTVLTGCTIQQQLLLVDAVYPDEQCDGDRWETDDGLPDPQVTVVSRATDESWTSQVVQNSLEPSWNTWVWDGQKVARSDLLDDGIEITALEMDEYIGTPDPEVAATAVAWPGLDDVASDTWTVELDCITVRFSVER